MNVTTLHFCLFVAALYGTLVESETEASYANHKFGRSFGHALAYAYSFYLCISTKVYILIAVLLVTMTTYSTLELLLYHKKRTDAPCDYNTLSNDRRGDDLCEDNKLK